MTLHQRSYSTPNPTEQPTNPRDADGCIGGARAALSVRGRWTIVSACFAVGVFAAASLGYAGGSGSSEPDPLPGKAGAEHEAVLAVSAAGPTSTLSADQEEQYEENIRPIDPSAVTFPGNRGLSVAQVKARQTDLSEDYQVGEPLTAEDLEFLRAYLIEAQPTATADAPEVETAAIQTAAHQMTPGKAAPAALYNLNQSFNVTRSGAGATANASGRITGGINFVDAYWAASWTTKRTSGRYLTKITSRVIADAFGAVASYPFVGKIYSRTYSATSPSGSNSWYFSRSGRVTGAVAYMQIDCRSFVYTSAGSFGLP